MSFKVGDLVKRKGEDIIWELTEKRDMGWMAKKYDVSPSYTMELRENDGALLPYELPTKSTIPEYSWDDMMRLYETSGAWDTFENPLQRISNNCHTDFLNSTLPLVIV